MNESELTTRILDYADGGGLLAHHCPDSRRCRGRRGFPDLVALGPGGILLAELKDPGGQTSAAQDLWLWTLHTARVRYAVWRPGDWHNGRIQAALRGLAGPAQVLCTQRDGMVTLRPRRRKLACGKFRRRGL